MTVKFTPFSNPFYQDSSTDESSVSDLIKKHMDERINVFTQEDEAVDSLLNSMTGLRGFDSSLVCRLMDDPSVQADKFSLLYSILRRNDLLFPAVKLADGTMAPFDFLGESYYSKEFLQENIEDLLKDAETSIKNMGLESASMAVNTAKEAYQKYLGETQTSFTNAIGIKVDSETTWPTNIGDPFLSTETGATGRSYEIGRYDPPTTQPPPPGLAVNVNSPQRREVVIYSPAGFIRKNNNRFGSGLTSPATGRINPGSYVFGLRLKGGDKFHPSPVSVLTPMTIDLPKL